MKPTKRPYTHDERLIILNYIIKQRQYYSLRGNSFWKEMEREGILDRSWQSIKQHFKVRIIDTLHLFNIPEEEKKKISVGYYCTCVQKNSHNKQKRDEFNNVTNNENEKEILSTFAKPTSVNENDDEIEIISISSTPSPDLPSDNIYNNDNNKIDHSKLEVNSTQVVKNVEEFSRDEDVALINFMKKDRKILRNRSKSFVYDFYIKMFGSSKSSKALNDRFNNHILPNLQDYRFSLTSKNILEICEECGLEIPNDLKSPQSSQKNIIMKDAATQIYQQGIMTEKFSNLFFITDVAEETNIN